MTPVPSTIACARGCTLIGRHAKDAHGDSDDGCRGCLPRPAVVGRLCQSCHGRITRALLDVGGLVEWIRENVVPGTWLGGRDDWIREAPAPLSIRAVDDADGLHALLWSWVVAPMFDGLVGPNRRGTSIRPMTKRTVAGMHRAACPDPDACVGCAVVYLDARAAGLRAQTGTPQDLAAPTVEVAAWMLRHLDRLADSPAVGDFHDELIDTWRSTAARWPRAQRDRKLPIPCPSCDRLMLWLHPPIAAGHPITIVCRTDACGRVLTEADYYWRVHELHREIAA